MSNWKLRKDYQNISKVSKLILILIIMSINIIMDWIGKLYKLHKSIINKNVDNLKQRSQQYCNWPIR